MTKGIENWKMEMEYNKKKKNEIISMAAYANSFLYYSILELK